MRQAAGPAQVPVAPPGLAVAVNRLIAAPPSAGAVKLTLAWPSPAVAVTAVGASGAVGTATTWLAPAVNASSPLLPAASVTLVDAFRSSLSVPDPAMPVTSTSITEPVDADTLLIVPDAVSVAVSVKSSVETLATDSLKVT